MGVDLLREGIIATSLNIVDVLAVLGFFISYYRNCYRKGYRLDFWYLQIFLVCVLPNMLMYPFASGIGNVIVLGRDYPAVAEAVPSVFIVTIAGYVAVLIGGALWRLRCGIGIRRLGIRSLSIIPECSMMLMASRDVLLLQSFVCVLMQAGILAVSVSKAGFSFDLRSFGFENPQLRPVIQIISFYSSIIASHCLARYLDRKEITLLFCNVTLAVGLLFFGSRGALITIYLPILVCFLIRRRDKLKLSRLMILAVSIVTVAFYLGNVRAGQYSISQFFAGAAFLLLYGNNFSDLRDFAWVYSAWDHSFWLGKTYLAALTAFVPRFVSSFRDMWGIGAATATTVGLDPQVHPGLRPGSFGESYFNFGFAGVLIAGILMGIIFRRVDIDVKRVFSSRDPSIMKAFASSMLLNIAALFAISATSSMLYVLVGVYAISWIMLHTQRMVRPAVRERSLE